MTEKDRPPYPNLDLGSVLKQIGHTPESFARVIGRNASGLRRAVKGMTTMHPSAAGDVAEGLAREGWTGDPNSIRQLRDAAHGKLTPRRGRVLPSGDLIMPDGTVTDPSGKPRVRSRREVPPSYRVRRALRELMQAVGREEVDRVYESVFGKRPNEKDK